MIMNTYREPFQVKLAEMSFGMWRQVEEESGNKLYMLVSRYLYMLVSTSHLFD